jgi:hypothetical protein
VILVDLPARLAIFSTTRNRECSSTLTLSPP